MNHDAFTHRRKLVAGLSGLVLLVGLMIALAFFFDIRSQAIRFLAWLEEAGPWGPIIFTGLVSMVVLLILPGVILTLGAGFLFGTIWGSVYIIVGTTLGATSAFLLGRFFFEEQAGRLLEQHAKLKSLNAMVERRPWQIVMLTRLIPFFPFKASNYAFGIMGVPCRDFVIGTAIGIIPFTLTNVYAGSLAKDLATLDPGSRTRPPWEWALYGLGLIVLLGFVVLLSNYARSRLNSSPETGRLIDSRSRSPDPSTPLRSARDDREFRVIPSEVEESHATASTSRHLRKAFEHKQECAGVNQPPSTGNEMHPNRRQP